MAAYVIGHVEIKDADGYARYSAQVAATVEKYGGRFLVRGGAYEVREGSFPKLRLVMLEFPDLAAARRWYGSPEYSPLIPQRQASTETTLLLVEGV
jgi:uncharacterized protein (DUF1330 family)